MKKIATTGTETNGNHREDFESCTHCDHTMLSDDWEKTAVILILSPRFYKAGSVAVMSECPKCFKKSWVHARMAGFEYNDAWPETWKEAVKQREAAVKLDALRDWGSGLCHGCRHLTGGSVDYNAWKYCIIGSGPVVKECAKFEPLAEVKRP